MRRAAWLSVLAGLAIVLLGAIAWWRPFLTQKRVFATTLPQPAPLFSIGLVPLTSGDPICFQPAVIDTHSTQAQFRVGTFGRPGEPIRVTMSAPGYRYATRLPGGYPDSALLDVPVRPPRHDVAARICLSNLGRHKVVLYGVNDRTRAPLSVTRGNRPYADTVQFVFTESKAESLARHMPESFEGMPQFRPGFVGPWLLWPLAVLCVFGVPLGALWALKLSVADEPDSVTETGVPSGVTETKSEITWERLPTS